MNSAAFIAPFPSHSRRPHSLPSHPRLPLRLPLLRNPALHKPHAHRAFRAPVCSLSSSASSPSSSSSPSSPPPRPNPFLSLGAVVLSGFVAFVTSTFAPPAIRRVASLITICIAVLHALLSLIILRRNQNLSSVASSGLGKAPPSSDDAPPTSAAAAAQSAPATAATGGTAMSPSAPETAATGGTSMSGASGEGAVDVAPAAVTKSTTVGLAFAAVASALTSASDRAALREAATAADARAAAAAERAAAADAHVSDLRDALHSARDDVAVAREDVRAAQAGEADARKELAEKSREAEGAEVSRLQLQEAQIKVAKLEEKVETVGKAREEARVDLEKARAELAEANAIQRELVARIEKDATAAAAAAAAAQKGEDLGEDAGPFRTPKALFSGLSKLADKPATPSDLPDVLDRPGSKARGDGTGYANYDLDDSTATTGSSPPSPPSSSSGITWPDKALDVEDADKPTDLSLEESSLVVDKDIGIPVDGGFGGLDEVESEKGSAPADLESGAPSSGTEEISDSQATDIDAVTDAAKDVFSFSREEFVGTTEKDSGIVAKGSDIGESELDSSAEVTADSVTDIADKTSEALDEVGKEVSSVLGAASDAVSVGTEDLVDVVEGVSDETAQLASEADESVENAVDGVDAKDVVDPVDSEMTGVKDVTRDAGSAVEATEEAANALDAKAEEVDEKVTEVKAPVSPFAYLRSSWGPPPSEDFVTDSSADSEEAIDEGATLVVGDSSAADATVSSGAAEEELASVSTDAPTDLKANSSSDVDSGGSALALEETTEGDVAESGADAVKMDSEPGLNGSSAEDAPAPKEEMEQSDAAGEEAISASETVADTSVDVGRSDEASADEEATDAKADGEQVASAASEKDSDTVVEEVGSSAGHTTEETSKAVEPAAAASPAENASAASLMGEARRLVASSRKKALNVEEADSLFSDAIAKLEKALQATDESAPALAQYGVTLLTWAKCDLNGVSARERLEESSRVLARALEKSPNDQASLFNRGLCVCLIAAAHSTEKPQDLYSEACQLFDKLLDLNQSSRVGLFNCGLAYVSRARLADADTSGGALSVECYREAEDRFRRVLALQPSDQKAAAYLDECVAALRKSEAV